MGAFLNNPALKRQTIYESGYDPQRPWMLLETLEYYSGVIERTVIVPSGFKTDFASVPWFFRRLFPQDGPWTLAAVVHDHFCVTKKYDYKVGALIFREAMHDLKVPAWQVCFMYRAVRWFGPRWG
jgi:hypothetical protein